MLLNEALTVQVNDAAAFLVEDAGGNDVLVINTTSKRIGIGGAPSVPLDVFTETSATNDALNLFRFTITSSGTAAAGFGIGVRFDLEAADGNVTFASRIATAWEDASNEHSSMSLSVARGGTVLERARLDSQGNILVGTAATPSGAEHNLVLGGGSATPVLGAATQDVVCLAAVDAPAGNRCLRIQPEAGGYFQFGGNDFRIAPTASAWVSRHVSTAITSGASSYPIHVGLVPANEVFCVDVQVTGRRYSGGSGSLNDCGMAHRRFLAALDGNGDVVLTGLQTIGTDSFPAGWGGLTVSAVNNQFLCTVQGDFDVNIRWSSDAITRRVA